MNILEAISMMDRNRTYDVQNNSEINLTNDNVYDLLKVATDKELIGYPQFYNHVFIYNVDDDYSVICVINRVSLYARLIQKRWDSGCYDIVANTKRRVVVKGSYGNHNFCSSAKDVIPIGVEPRFYNIAGESIENVFSLVQKVSGKMVWFKELDRVLRLGISSQWLFYGGSSVSGFIDADMRNLVITVYTTY